MAQGLELQSPLGSPSTALPAPELPFVELWLAGWFSAMLVEEPVGRAAGGKGCCDRMSSTHMPCCPDMLPTQAERVSPWQPRTPQKTDRPGSKARESQRQRGKRTRAVTEGLYVAQLQDVG
jgi:hypothetical protein